MHSRLGLAINEPQAISRTALTSYEQVRREKIVGGMCFLAGFLTGPVVAQIEITWRWTPDESPI